jgi:MFS family permease
VLGLAGYSAVPALLPQFVSIWSLSNAQAGWLAGAFFLGYMCAVVPLVALTDHLAPRRIYLASAVLNLAYYFGFATVGGLNGALALQFLGGVALAGMYMPGLRAITTEARSATRARTVAWYTSSFTVGAALSFMFMGQAAGLLGWHSAFIAAGLCAAAALLLSAVALPSGASPSQGGSPRLSDLPKVLRNRQVLGFIIAYAAVIWSTVGVRNWIVLFLYSSPSHRAVPPSEDWLTLGTATIVNLLGVPAALLGNELSIRFGLRRTAAAIFFLGAATGGLFGFAAPLPFYVLVGLALICAFIVQGNFANLTAGLLGAAEPERTGLTVAVYSFTGFAGSFLGPLVFGSTLDRFGGSGSVMGWGLAYGTCGLASIAGAFSLLLLVREDE